MKHRAVLGAGLILLVMAFFFFPAQAHADLDPRTGSHFIQPDLAALIGALFAVQLIWDVVE